MHFQTFLACNHLNTFFVQALCTVDTGVSTELIANQLTGVLTSSQHVLYVV